MPKTVRSTMLMVIIMDTMENTMNASPSSLLRLVPSVRETTLM